MEWCFFDYAKALWLDASSYADFLQTLQTAFLCFPFLSDFCQIFPFFSSQPCMTWHKPWRSLLPCKRNGHANPRGSHIEFITESMPPLLIGWSFKLILNFITSFLASLNIPNAFSIGRLPVQSLSFAASLLSASGIWNSISFLLLMNFVYLNPPFLHRSLTS